MDENAGRLQLRGKMKRPPPWIKSRIAISLSFRLHPFGMPVYSQPYIWISLPVQNCLSTCVLQCFVEFPFFFFLSLSVFSFHFSFFFFYLFVEFPMLQNWTNNTLIRNYQLVFLCNWNKNFLNRVPSVTILLHSWSNIVDEILCESEIVNHRNQLAFFCTIEVSLIIRWKKFPKSSF